MSSGSGLGTGGGSSFDSGFVAGFGSALATGRGRFGLDRTCLGALASGAAVDVAALAVTATSGSPSSPAGVSASASEVAVAVPEGDSGADTGAGAAGLVSSPSSMKPPWRTAITATAASPATTTAASNQRTVPPELGCAMWAERVVRGAASDPTVVDPVMPVRLGGS